MAQNLPRGTPARVLVLLSLLTGLVTVSVWRDALQRPGNTWIRYPTALGDPAFLQPGHLPAEFETPGGRVALTAGGAPLRRRDDRMFRVRTGMEQLLPFSLFTADENLAADPDPKLYARTAPHEYLRLRARLVDEAAPPQASPEIPGKPRDPALVERPSVRLTEKPVQPKQNSAEAKVVEGLDGTESPDVPQVPPHEDPDHALALPAPARGRSEAPATPDVRGEDAGTASPVALPPALAPEPPAPKAIPLPPDEQDSPGEEAAGPTL